MAKTIECWITEEAGLKRVQSISQIYTKRRADGSLAMLLAKLTDDLLLPGPVFKLNLCAKLIKSRFAAGKVVINSTVMFNGFRSPNINVDIEILIQKYPDKIKPAQNTPKSTRPSEAASSGEVHDFRRSSGELVWLGSGTLPQAAYF